MHLLPLIARSFLLAAVIGAVGIVAYGRGVDIGETYGTFQVHGIDLKVDSTAFYNGTPYPLSTWTLKDLKPWVDKFFWFDDVKPGDTGTTVMSLHIRKASAWVCLEFDRFREKENGRNEPEQLVDSSPLKGELGEGLEFFSWFDDGDNVFEVGEKPLFGTTTQSAVKTLKRKVYPLADSTTGAPFAKDSTHYIGVLWCAGNLSVDLATAQVSCDGGVLGNAAQTDSLSVGVWLTAVPSTKHKKFTCKRSGGYSYYDHDDEYAWYDWDHGGEGEGHPGSCRVGRW